MCALFSIDVYRCSIEYFWQGVHKTNKQNRSRKKNNNVCSEEMTSVRDIIFSDLDGHGSLDEAACFMSGLSLYMFVAGC